MIQTRASSSAKASGGRHWQDRSAAPTDLQQHLLRRHAQGQAERAIAIIGIEPVIARLERHACGNQQRLMAGAGDLKKNLLLPFQQDFAIVHAARLIHQPIDLHHLLLRQAGVRVGRTRLGYCRAGLRHVYRLPQRMYACSLGYCIGFGAHSPDWNFNRMHPLDCALLLTLGLTLVFAPCSNNAARHFNIAATPSWKKTCAGQVMLNTDQLEQFSYPYFRRQSWKLSFRMRQYFCGKPRCAPHPLQMQNISLGRARSSACWLCLLRCFFARSVLA